MNKIINSRYFKWFRKLYLKDLYKKILRKGKPYFCCSYESFYTFFIDWKELKEVKENMDSKFLRNHDFYGNEVLIYTCSKPWFDSHYDRLKFLEECISKF